MSPLRGHGETRLYQDGEIIFTEGSAGRHLYVVADGAVRIRKSGAVVDTVLTDLGPGEMLGEIALIDNKPHSATATAVGPTTLEALDRDRFVAALRDDPDIAFSVISSLAGRLRDASERLQQIATQHVLDRTELALIQKAILESDLV